MFKPNRLTKRDIESRKWCNCQCHWEASSGGWGETSKGLGITDEESTQLINQGKG